MGDIRVAGGMYRGRKLETPPGQDTRPSLSKTREALFSIVQGVTPDALVLDLFAGSGALGFEALSRGARQLVFCDKATAAHKALRNNVRSLGVSDQSRLLQMDWQRALKTLSDEGATFDLIVLDPPYHADYTEILTTLSQADLLSEGGLMVAEHLSTLSLTAPVGYQVDKVRRYGTASLTVFSRVPNGSPDVP